MPDNITLAAQTDRLNRQTRRAKAAVERHDHPALVEDESNVVEDVKNVGFYTKTKVCQLTTLTPTTLWRRIRAGDFPRGVQLSPNRVGWSRQAVHDWINRKTSEAARAAQESAAAGPATETSP